MTKEEQTIDAAMHELEKHPKEALIRLTHVVYKAFDIWKTYREGKSVDDFCIQNIHDEGIIFGGWNRVYWNIDSGWSVSSSHCSNEFYEHATNYLNN
jgi:hypothetical protein